MRTDELKTYSSLGSALWTEPGYSEQALVEILTAAGLADASEERRFERAASQLLSRAMREGNAANARSNLAVLNQPFFRLDARDRFVLVALHLGHWSYERLGRIMELSSDALQELAWQARLRLCADSGKYPIGTSRRESSTCPEYDLRTPWTQRFFDEEMAPKERLFIQNHVMACNACREVVARCRDVYYAVESLLPRAEPEQRLLERLSAILGSARKLHSQPKTARETFAIFFSRVDVLVAIGLLVALIAYAALN